MRVMANFMGKRNLDDIFRHYRIFEIRGKGDFGPRRLIARVDLPDAAQATLCFTAKSCLNVVELGNVFEISLPNLFELITQPIVISHN